MIWKTLDNDELDPLEWGWSFCNSNYEPISTNTKIAPEQLLHFRGASVKLNVCQ